MIRRLHQHGDTIVEVLVAILIVSIVLSGAFASARKSQTGIRQTQERSEALKVAEGQLEQLKVLAKSSPVSLTASADEVFCIYSNAGALTKQVVTSNVRALTDDDLTDTNYHPSVCNVSPVAGVTYYSLIEHQVATNTFIAHTRWFAAGGGDNQEVILAVRIDP